MILIFSFILNVSKPLVAPLLPKKTAAVVITPSSENDSKNCDDNQLTSLSGKYSISTKTNNHEPVINIVMPPMRAHHSRINELIGVAKDCLLAMPMPTTTHSVIQAITAGKPSQ